MSNVETMGQRADQQAQRRRVLFSTLQPFMKRDALYEALWVWEEQHATQPAASIQRFLASLCANPSLMARRNDINRSLVEAMQPGSPRLGPDPMKEMLAFRNRVAGTPSTVASARPRSSPGNTVLEAVILGLHERLMRLNPQMYPSYLQFVTENLSILEMPVNAEAEMASFIHNMKDRLTEVYAPEDMQGVLHLMYVGACEYFGPVKTDELLSSSIAEAEKLKEASVFPPRNLL